MFGVQKSYYVNVSRADCSKGCIHGFAGAQQRAEELLLVLEEAGMLDQNPHHVRVQEISVPVHCVQGYAELAGGSRSLVESGQSGVHAAQGRTKSGTPAIK